MSVDNGLAWINLWQALRENGFSQFVRWQSQMGRNKRENTQIKVEHEQKGEQKNQTKVLSEHQGKQIDQTKAQTEHQKMQKNQTKVQSEHQGMQIDQTKVLSEHQGKQKNQTNVQSDHQGEQKKENKIIPLDTWLAGWEALRRNGFGQFVGWTQLGREEKSEPKSDNDLWIPPWGKKDSTNHKTEGEKLGYNDSRGQKSVSIGNNNSWQPPWGKKDSIDHKMDVKMNKEEGEEMAGAKSNPREPMKYVTPLPTIPKETMAVSAEHGIEQPSSGKMDSMNPKMGLQIVDQKKHLKQEKGTGNSMETKTILLDHDSWQKLMKGLKIEKGIGDPMEPKTISLDHDLKKTLMQKGKQLAVNWTQ